MTKAAAVRRRPKAAPRRPAKARARRAGAGARVNARLDAATAAVLRQLVRMTGLSVTDVIKLSLTRLAEHHEPPAEPVTAALADLVGCFSDDAELASSSKDQLVASLVAKHAP